jgi:uncharacterized protein YbcC (UPF0753/DUF2309 family)
MQPRYNTFDAQASVKKLKHYLPTQAPLKDFVHHNTLHAFQHEPFFLGLNEAHEIFGYKVFLTIQEYRSLHANGRISNGAIQHVLDNYNSSDQLSWKEKMLFAKVNDDPNPRVGKLRDHWKSIYHIDLDSQIHPTLFRIVGSYLDQGISLWKFPITSVGFLDAMAELERNGLVSFFKTEHVRNLLLYGDTSLEHLLEMVVGNEELYERYLFDQQFAHPGWSGIVSVIEENPKALVDQKGISLEEFIRYELLMEIDVLDDHFGEIWAPLGMKIKRMPQELFHKVPVTESSTIKQLWQSAFEWSYYDTVLKGLTLGSSATTENHAETPSFQAVFCIDDRECSIRRHVEALDADCSTYGTAGFFNIDAYFQPASGKFNTKICPAPLSPKHLIKEIKEGMEDESEFHFGKHTHGLLAGWILTHTLGFISAFKLFLTVFRPKQSSTSVSPQRHMNAHATLTIHHEGGFTEDGLQIGYTYDEMTDRLETLLRSIGFTNQFGPIVYLVGHGSSSVNNTHYAGYDCGACCGRPGSVNARVMAFISNQKEVRNRLNTRGIEIPDSTRFVGVLHDTSRDEFTYYDVSDLSVDHQECFNAHQLLFDEALSMNAKERSRRFEYTKTNKASKVVHQAVKKRTVSLFEPRPELNHATNALAIVGRRSLSKNIFLDRRSFLNSYDYTQDREGKYLLNILNAVAPVCGGINLEYYFSRVDNQNLGAGTKLPHNVMGLIGIANGIEGDLRTGLPSQMIEVHEPVRLMVIVEHYSEVVLKAIQTNPSTFEWFENEWVRLAVIHPEGKRIKVFENGTFVPYEPFTPQIPAMLQPEHAFEKTIENLPVSLLTK